MVKNSSFLYLIFIILIFLSSNGCKEEKAKDYIEYTEDLVFTDSFSPDSWEYPIARKGVKAGDKDIGYYIKEDVLNPDYRELLNLVRGYLSELSENNIEKVREVMQDSAYNALKLHYPDVEFSSDYDIRVEQTDLINNEYFWVKFKLMFPKISIVTEIEIFNNGKELKINDFENSFLKKLKEMEE